MIIHQRRVMAHHCLPNILRELIKKKYIFQCKTANNLGTQAIHSISLLCKGQVQKLLNVSDLGTMRQHCTRNDPTAVINITTWHGIILKNRCHLTQSNTAPGNVTWKFVMWGGSHTSGLWRNAATFSGNKLMTLETKDSGNVFCGLEFVFHVVFRENRHWVPHLKSKKSASESAEWPILVLAGHCLVVF